MPMVNARGNPLPPNKQSEIGHNIAENNGGGIYAISSTIELTQSYTSTLTQTQQTLVEVECIYSRVLNLKKDHEYQQYHVRLMINNNSAQYGGGIVVADDTQRSACRGGATETDATQCWLASLNCIHGTRRIYNISTHSWLTTWLPCQEQTSTEVCWTGVQ